MKKKSNFQSGFFHLRILVGLVVALRESFWRCLPLARSQTLSTGKGNEDNPNASGKRPGAGSQVIGDSFWASTGGPQGGDGSRWSRMRSGYVFAGTLGGGVFRSTDNGETWTPVNNGLTATDIRALATNSAGRLFAGTFGGVFRSTDNGDTWTPVNNGLDYPFIVSLAINSSGDIFAGTSKAAVFTARPIKARTGRWSITA